MPTNSFPRKEEVVFLACEDIRIEAGGQHTFVGTYTGGGLLLKAQPSENAAMKSLSFFLQFPNLEPGSYECRIEVVLPDGEVAGNATQRGDVLKPVSPLLRAAMVVMLNFTPFPIQLGQYKIRATIDEEKYEWDFPVVLSPEIATS
ncbi:hypothetical protein [Achromobacter sp. PAB15]|uniref:hypothetical protein n=1 Tax=Achromobacter sp. PAB15 TaxID=3233048 RepID=UPI003F9155FA